MLLKCDAAQLEWRVLAWLANDKVAIDEINADIDFHTENQKLFNLPSRLISKIYLFRTIFRGSGYAFSKDPAFSHVSSDPEFWDDINDKFFKKYKGVDRCHQEWARTVAARQPIVSPFGREWLIPLRQDGKLPWTVLSNYPVQGTGNDIMALARVSLLRRLRNSTTQSAESLLVSTVHDDIKADVRDEDAASVARLMYEVFDDIPKNVKRLWGIELPIQFPCEVKMGPNLQDLTKVQR